jgi:ABC-type nitrate/sulfonate/bicarbonate transport system substrate-binding protein
MGWAVRLAALVSLLVLAAPAAFAGQAAAPIQLEVSLGDVSLNKVPFLVAADAGIYAKHGLPIRRGARAWMFRRNMFARARPTTPTSRWAAAHP